MAINAQNRNLPDWFTRIRTRQTVLPRFQRFEAWGHANIAQIFNTILQGLPVGALLVLEIGNEEPFVSRPLEGAPDTGERITEHLLDGQQRLTALWRGLHNTYDERTYFLNWSKHEETGHPYFVEAVARWRPEGDQERRKPHWADRPDSQWKRRLIPLDLLAPGEGPLKAFNEWAKSAIEDRDERDEVKDFVNGIREKFATFNLPYLSLPVTTPKETALDVFLKMNTSAAPLSTYDIVVAQVEAAMEQSLHDLIGTMRQAAPTIGDYYPLESLCLAAGALLLGKPPSNTTYLAKGFGSFLLEQWEKLLRGIKRTAAFLEEERVFDAQRLPTETVIPVLVALWAYAPDGLDGEGRARTLLRKYMWRAFFTNRYENSTQSRSLADYQKLKELIAGAPDAAQPEVFNDELYPLPQPAELMAARWPKSKDRLARAILAASLRQGGLDLADGGVVSRENLTRREYHHLFPDALLTKHDVPEHQIYSALNCALVTWRTNRNISDKTPERYLAERLDGTEVTAEALRHRLATHLIPHEAMAAGSFHAFREARAELVHGLMQRLCGGHAV